MDSKKQLEKEFLAYLNSIGSPIIKTYFDRSVNKKYTKKTKYGNWLRYHNRILFNNGFSKWLVNKK